MILSSIYVQVYQVYIGGIIFIMVNRNIGLEILLG